MSRSRAMKLRIRWERNVAYMGEKVKAYREL